jgi:hypothetical protein
MVSSQIMLYILSAVTGIALLIAPSLAVMFDVANFDRGKNPNTSVVFADWMLQFLVFCGLAILFFSSFVEAKNYKEPTKDHLIFLSAQNILTDGKTFEPKKQFVNNLNEVIESNQNVFIVVIDDWATGKSIQFVNKFVREDFGVNAEVIGVLPKFKHNRIKSDRILSWLQLNEREWDSITILDSGSFSNLESVGFSVIGGLKEDQRDLLKLHLSSEKKTLPKVVDLVPTEMKLTTKPYFGGRRLLNGQDITDQTSRKELEAANARSIYRSSPADIQHRGQTP